MKLLTLNVLSLLAASLIPTVASANDFPTTTRVEYVLECMQQHHRDYEYFYKCSCAIDEIAKQTSFEDFAHISTASKYLHLGGERGGEFRDPKQVKVMAKKYKMIEANANNACFIQPQPEK